MAKCKFNYNLNCDLFDDPEHTCWYEDLEDCLCFRTGKYKNHDDVNKKGDCNVEFFNKREHVHNFLKRLLIKMGRK